VKYFLGQEFYRSSYDEVFLFETYVSKKSYPYKEAQEISARLSNLRNVCTVIIESVCSDNSQYIVKLKLFIC